MSVNKVILLGNVGQDPQVKYFDTGSAVATFRLATTDRVYTLQNGTQVPERTEWHNIVASNRLAEIVDKYVHKGDKLYLEGKIRTRSYSDQSGAMRYITEIYVDNMEMLSPKGANPGAGGFCFWTACYGTAATTGCQPAATNAAVAGATCTR
ncbi:single-stranded DNA-binding protein [Bacteroides ovatus]|nr:single-stranded DNA-binding protein [Bacteroides ovatus]